MEPALIAIDDDAAATLCRALKLDGFFPEFTKDQVRGVFPNGRLALYPAGSVILKQGDRGRDLYVVHRGRVIVRKEGSSGIADVASLGPGEVFGEIGLMKTGVRTANVLAAEESQVFTLLQRDLQYLLANNPALRQHLQQLALQRL